MDCRERRGFEVSLKIGDASRVEERGRGKGGKREKVGSMNSPSEPLLEIVQADGDILSVVPVEDPDLSTRCWCWDL